MWIFFLLIVFLLFIYYSTVATALNLVWPNFCQEKDAFLRQFESFICLTKIPHLLILHICWRDATVRCILLCSKLYLLSIKYNPVAINIPAELCVSSSPKQKRHLIQSFWHLYQKGLLLMVTLDFNLPLEISPIHLNEIEFRMIFREKV